MATKTKRIVVFESYWNTPNENPQVLPFIQALVNLHQQPKTNSDPKGVVPIEIVYRTVRTKSDLTYYLSSQDKNISSNNLLYLASHGIKGFLSFSNNRNEEEFWISHDEVCNLLEANCKGVFSHIHFAACGYFAGDKTWKKYHEIIKASNAKYVSGYRENIDWIESMFVDLAYIYYFYINGNQQNKSKINNFESSYNELARLLGFTICYIDSNKNFQFFPIDTTR